MDIEFDPAKRVSNLRKHGLDLKDAPRLFGGLYLEMEDDREDYGEDRWIAIGMIFGVVAVCVWSPRNDDMVRRIISLRKADDDETKAYFEHI